MDDTRVLYDAFNIYYEKGMEALNANNLEVAKRNIFQASETLLALAKVSKGVLKAERINRANQLYDLGTQIESKIKARKKRVISNEDKVNKSNNNKSEEESLSLFEPVKGTGIKLDDVAGLENVKEEINRLIIEPRKHPEVFERFKKKKGGGILLYGVPGTGKTMIAQAIASEIDAKFFSVKCSDIVSKWFGDSERNIKKLFEEAKKYPCSIIFFDEFEALGTKRDSNSTVMKRIVPELLAQIQGFEKNENTLIVMGATNRPWDIDSAFLRPGRFNTCIHVSLPDEEARRAIVNKQLSNVPVDEDLNVEDIVSKTSGFNASDVVEFCDKLKDFAIKRSIDTGVDSFIKNEDVELTSQRVKSSVMLEDIEKILDYEHNHLKGL